jgi:hypothetical protein
MEKLDFLFIFICGCPRSGTTALWRLLSADDRCVIGVERYGNRFFSDEFIEPAHFRKERFLSLENGDTFYSNLNDFNSYYTNLDRKFDEAIYRGDKIPKLYEYFERVKNNFHGAKIIMIFRNIFDVAASYKLRKEDPLDNWDAGVAESIRDWNKSLESGLSYREQLNIKFVDYEKIFSRDGDLSGILKYLDLDVSDKLVGRHSNLIDRSNQLEQARSRNLTSVEVKEICLHADFARYREICRLMAEDE